MGVTVDGQGAVERKLQVSIRLLQMCCNTVDVVQILRYEALQIRDGRDFGGEIGLYHLLCKSALNNLSQLVFWKHWKMPRVGKPFVEGGPLETCFVIYFSVYRGQAGIAGPLVFSDDGAKGEKICQPKFAVLNQHYRHKIPAAESI